MMGATGPAVDHHLDSADPDADADPDWTLLLPDEVLERVLGAVPALDLVRSARLVCRRWRRVLSGRPAWRRVRVCVRAGREGDACRVLRVAPALARLDLFPGDRVPTTARGAALLLDAVRASRPEVRSLSLDWRHFAADAASRSCFHGVLAALGGSLRHLDVGLVGVQPVEEGASPLQPRPAPAIAAVAALPALRSLRLRALFDPCWYFDEMRAPAPAHALRSLDAAGCQPYLARLLADVLSAHRDSLRALRLTARGLAAGTAGTAGLHFPDLRRLDVDLECQDAAVALPEGLSGRLDRLTLVRMNRRLPVPGRDEPSATVRSLALPAKALPWSIVLEDCLVSPADLAALLHGLGQGGPGLDREPKRLVLLGGCFLGTEQQLRGLAEAPTSTRTSLDSQGLRLCPRDQTTGLYPLALEC